MHVPEGSGFARPRRFLVLAACLSACAIAAGTSARAQQQVVGGTNVNIVSGTSFPDGDPFLQRQNEPSSAASTRNPLHLLAGANDYRTVDLPGTLDPLKGFEANADAWVGLFKSFDGGQTWRSTLLPGFPQDVSAAGLASPLKGRQAATDPVVRAGTNGLFYYAGVAFDRGDNKPSTIFVARFLDLNNKEAGDPIAYLSTSIVASSPATPSLDKTALAVDIPRSAATCTIDAPLGDGTTVGQVLPAGTVYVGYAAFSGSGASTTSQIMVSRSTNCGQSWSTPVSVSAGTRLNQNAQIAIDPSSGAVYVSWRVFRSGTQGDGVYIAKSTNGGVSFGKAVRVAPVYPYDQGTSLTSFRTNGFQTMTVDGNGRVYVAWSERGRATERSSATTGDARIVVSTSATGATWTPPQPIRIDGLGHQLMPALSFQAGRLRMVYYDLRDDVSRVFGPYVDEAQTSTLRHTLDVYIAQALPGIVPVFTSVRLSDYATGYFPDSPAAQQLQFNPPNLPLFRQGTVPFMGDYLDLAPAPTMVRRTDGTWAFNTQAGDSMIAHAFWTDNRDVRPPPDGNWQNYTPVISDSLKSHSIFDPNQIAPQCVPGHTGMRNQNVYTARVTEGLFVGSPGNAKPLGTIPRAFVVTVRNEGAIARSYRLTIANQPAGGAASFTPLTPGAVVVTTNDVAVPAYSTVARSVYATATQLFPLIRVDVAEIAAPGAPTLLAGGLTGAVVLNADPSNPSIQNPSLQNPSIQNPSIQNAEVYNPELTNAFVANPSIQNPSIQNVVLNPSIQNPSLQNPSLQNPSLQNDAVANPSIVNPSIQNPSIQNPSIQNPSIQNPSIQNADLLNGSIEDTTWHLTNEGNTTASYTIKLLLNNPIPAGFGSQLILHKTYTTPAALGCTLAVQPHTILVANIPNPTFVAPQNPSIQNPSIQNPSIQNPTISLAPGETAEVTLRIVDPNRFDGTVFEPAAEVVPATVAHAVNTEDAAAGITQPRFDIAPAITTPRLASAVPGAPYQQVLQTFSTGTATNWTVTSGSLPPGLLLDSGSGTITGTPTAPGNYVFTVQSTDGNNRTASRQMAIQINPVAPAGFTRVWNGADSNWSNPKNWSPNGVPTTTDDVYIAAGLPVMPVLTQNVTVRNLRVDSGATVTATGFVLTVLEGVDAGHTITGGTVELPGPAAEASGIFPNLSIGGRATLLGPVGVVGNLTLGPSASVNTNGLRIDVTGSLITNSPTQPPSVEALTTRSELVVGSANVNGLNLRNVTLSVAGGTLTRLDAASFSNYSSAVDQLTIDVPGTPLPANLNGISFATEATGNLVAVNRLAGPAPLVINFVDAVPSDGSGRTVVSNGAVVNWITTPATANLSVNQSLSGSRVVGGQLTYLTTVVNGGPASAGQVVVTDTLPASVAIVSATASGAAPCQIVGTTVTCTFPQLAAGAAASVQVIVSPLLAGSLSNTVTAAGAAPDPVAANNSHTLTSAVIGAEAAADVSLTKSDSTDPVAPGGPLTYTLRVHNGGPGLAQQVSVRDEAPAGITFTAATTDRGSCTVSPILVTCTITTLGSGEDATVTISALAGPAPAFVTNYATAASDNDPNPANNVAAQSTVISAACGVPAFASPIVVPASMAGSVFSLSAADIDGNGTTDLVVSSATATGVTVRLNDGTGHFTSTPIFSGATSMRGTAVADFDGDAKMDVAVVGNVGATGRLWILHGDGTGAFPSITSTDLGTNTPFTVAAGSFSEDGRPDLVVGIIGLGGPAILLNDGSGGFPAMTTLTTGSNPTTFAVADFDADGHLDIVAGHRDSAFVSFLKGVGNGTFAAAVNHATGAGPSLRTIGDVNGDGRLDLVVVDRVNATDTVSRLTTLAGDGAGGFGPQIIRRTGATIHTAALGDVNGDGHVDLVSTTQLSNDFTVQLGDGAGGFAAAVGYGAPIFSQVVLTDLNGDARLDVAIGDETGVIRVFLNSCGQTQTDLSVAATASPNPVDEGAPLAYQVTVTNLSPTPATNVMLTAVLPRSVLVQTAGGPGMTCTTTGTIVYCTLASLAGGAQASAGFGVTPTAGGTLEFTADVLADGADPNPSNNRATLSTTVNATGQTIVVTNTNDSGAGSLRQAILDSNADVGDVDRITFNIPGEGVKTITPLSALPTVSQPAVIDGATQPGFAGTPVIELNGTSAGTAASGLIVSAGGSTIRSLAINRFGGNGVLLQSNGNNLLTGNYLGTSPDGAAARGNGGSGVSVASGTGNTIGGTTSGAGNLISGNGSGITISGTGTNGNIVRGNVIGPNATLSAIIGNQGNGIFIGAQVSGTIIGGPVAGAGNTIAASQFADISIAGTNTTVQGNTISTNTAGTVAWSTGAGGVTLSPTSANNLIGGPTAAARNLIAGTIAGHVGSAVFVAGSGNQVVGNYLGTNAAGEAGVGNDGAGIGFDAAATNTTISGNVVAGSYFNGISLNGSGHVVTGNRIGTNAAGTIGIPNGRNVGGGILVNAGSSGHTIGGATVAAANQISGNNNYGIDIAGNATQVLGNVIATNVIGVQIRAGATGNVLQNNSIGTHTGAGVRIDNASTNTVGGTAAGAGNTIQGNGTGVVVLAQTSAANAILGNSIFGNTLLGIDLDNDGITANDPGDADPGPNRRQNFPLLTAAVVSGSSTNIQGTLTGPPSTSFRIEFFSNASCDASGNGEGQTFLGAATVSTDGTGTATFQSTQSAAAGVVTATATDAAGNTSEFSPCRATANGPATFVVTNTGDSGAGSLRQAMLAANASLGTLDTISFNIPGAGPYTISPLSPLPIVTDPVILDGTTQQPGAGAIPIELDGTNAGGTTNGIWIAAGGSTIRGFVINRFGTGGATADGGGAGIVLQGSGSVVEGNLIGTDATGMIARPNRADGVWTDGSNNRIGGTTLAVGGTVNVSRNVISGNGRHGIVVSGSAASTNLILGNFIGLSRNGTADLGNTGDGINLFGAQRTEVGGLTPAARNVVSGNDGNGVVLISGASFSLVQGNYIGTDATGSSAVGNALDGVSLLGSSSNTVGGFSPAARNVISGNGARGVALSQTSHVNSIVSNFIGTNAAGTGDLGNGAAGVDINGSSGNAIGDPAGPNRVAFNGGHGVLVFSGNGNRITLNAIFSSGGLGINLGSDTITPNDPGDTDSGANNLQNFPVITSAVASGSMTTVQGTLNTIASTTFRIEFFSNPTCDPLGNGEGATFLGAISTTTGATGAASFNTELPATAAGSRITATATDPNGNTSEFSTCQTVTETAAPPIANAGADQSVNAGDQVQLDGTASSDPAGRPLTYSWVLESRPAGSSATLVGPATAAPTFTADLPGTYVARLIVNNGLQDSAPDTIQVSTNGPPIARAGVDQTVPVGSLVQLDGSASSDPENAPLTYHWIFNTRPAASTAQLSNPNIANPTFVADAPGAYALQLVVNDGLVNSASDGILIVTANRPPVANAGPDQTEIPINGTVSLDGTASSDPDGTPITFSWSFALRPAGSTATLLNASTATPSFTADRQGRFRVTLTVNDGQTGASDIVDVTTVNAAPIANAGADRSVRERDLVTLDGSGSSDPDATPLTYAWTLVSKPAASTAVLASASSVAPSFTADLPGAYLLRLIVNDGIADSAPDEVTITALSSAMMLSLIDTPLVGAGRQAGLRVTLPWEAPPGGVTVTISSDNPGIVSITNPGTIVIPAGQMTGEITVNGVATGTTVIRATAPAYADAELQVTVTQNILSAPATLNVALGATASFPVTIPSAAPAGGLVINLGTSDPNAVQLVTPTVTIPVGAVGANGTVRGLNIGTSTVTASRVGYSSASSIVSTTAQLNILETSLNLRPSFPATMTIRLDSAGAAVAAPAPGVQVTLVAGNPGCVATNSPRTIPTGLISVDALVTYGGTATLPCTTTLTAQSPGVTSETVNVTVNPNPGITLGSSQVSVGSGLQYGTFSGTLGEAQHGGVTVRLTSSDPAIMKLSPNATTAGTDFIDVTLLNGQSNFSYYIQGVEGALGDATITATAPQFTNGTNLIHVVQAGIDIQSLTTTMTSLDASNDFYVRTGVRNVSGSTTFLSPIQAPRIGGSGITATLVNTNSAVAQLTTQAGSGQSRTVTIAPGQFNSPTSVATGGIAFDPLSGGTTQVSVTAPGFTPTTAGTVTVTVNAPGITLNSGNASVGAGLQYGSFSGTLGGSQHGGATVRLTSSNPAVLKLSPNATTAGTDFIEFVLNNGQTSFNYYIQGVEGALGDATITATSAQFTNGTSLIHVVQPGLDIQGLSGTMTSLDASSDFYVRAGVRNVSGSITFLSPIQAPRIGGSGITATLANTNSAVAQLTTQAGSGQSRTVTIAPGQFNSPTSVATGGVAFDPIGGGTTQVSVSAPGFTPTTAGTVTVTVNAPGITLNSANVSVGAGLQYGSFSGTLGGSQHGGVTVRLASNNPAVLKLSPNSTTAGTDFIEFVLSNGQTSFSYYLQGVEGAVGDATITATSSQFTDGTSLIHVVQPGIDIQSLSTIMTSLDASNDFYVRTGVRNVSGSTTFLSPIQAPRVGGSGITATLANTNSAVAQLTTQAGSGQSRTVTIAPGQFNSPTSVATGGVAFDPIGGGTTQVSVTAPGFTPTTAGTVTVTVNAPGITLNSGNASVGAGLQYGSFTGTLGGSQHGGVTVRLTSNNPAVLKLSPNSTTAGTDFIEFVLSNGQTTFSYYLQGMEGTTGGTTITASAPGFTDQTSTIQVVQPGIDIQGLAASQTSLNPNNDFYVRLGVPGPNNTFISPIQAPRSGGSAITVTLSNSNSAVAQLVTLAGTGQTRTVSIAPGQFNSPTSTATGGVAFDPLGTGTTVVTASAPGVVATTNATVQVTVSTPDITLSSPSVTLGAGLQSGTYSGSLGGSQHNGVTVRIASSNPSVLRIAPNGTTEGTAFIDITLASGVTTFNYWVEALEGTTGDVTLTASAPQFTSATGTVHVVQPALQIESLPTSMNATAASVLFRVRTGIADVNGAFLTNYQSARAGTSLVVTLTNSNAAAAQLVTLAGGDQSRTVIIPSGQNTTGNTLAAGGIEFDPLSAGTTTVAASIPNFFRTTAGAIVIVINP